MGVKRTHESVEGMATSSPSDLAAQSQPAKLLRRDTSTHDATPIHEKLEFLAQPDSLQLKLELSIDPESFRKFCRPALKCLIADGIDIYKMQGPSVDRPETAIHVMLHAPFHQSFASLAEVADGTSEEFTAVPMPPSTHGKVWHALEVLAVLVDSEFVSTIHGYGFQHICDAAVIAHFLHNEVAFTRLSPSKPSLGDLLLPPAQNVASSRELDNMKVLLQLPDDITATWAAAMRPKDALLLPQFVVNVWFTKAYPLKLDLKNIMLPFTQLISLCSAIKCTPKLEQLSLRLRTHRKSHGKAYKDSVCTPPAYTQSGSSSVNQGCAVCARCKDDDRMGVLAAAMPFVTELQTLELIECMFDFGSSRQFMWVLAPLVNLKTLKISEGANWLFHCARWSLFSAAVTLPSLRYLDLSGNSWNVLAFVLRPLYRSKSIEKVNLTGSLILDSIPADLVSKIEGAQVLNILPSLAISDDHND